MVFFNQPVRFKAAAALWAATCRLPMIGVVGANPAVARSDSDSPPRTQVLCFLGHTLGKVLQKGMLHKFCEL